MHPGLHSRGPSGRQRAGDRVVPEFHPGLDSPPLQAAVGARRCRIPGVAPRSPGVAPRASFPRPFGPPSVRGVVGFPELHTERDSRGPSGRRRRAAVSSFRGCTSESRGCTPGFIPAALQAGRERAIEWCRSFTPGLIPLPFRPPSVRGGVGFPGLHPGLCSCGHSGRRGFGEARGRVSEVSPADSRGCTPGFIPAALQAAGVRAIDWRSPGVAQRV